MAKKIFIILSLLAMVACNNTGSGKGTLTIGITDAPIDSAEVVNITFTKIEIAKGSEDTEEWTTYFEGSQKIDLLNFQNGDVFNFPDKELELGEYGQVRLFLSSEDGDNTITIDGETQNLAYNAGVANSGLKLVGGFLLEEGVGTKLTIDFDVRKSIVVKGGNNNPTYNLKPTIKLIQENTSVNLVITGASADTTYYIYDSETAITDEESATNEDDETVPYINAITSGISVTEDGVTTVTLPFIPYGSYKIYTGSYTEDGTANPLQIVDLKDNETDVVTLSAESESQVSLEIES